MQTYKKRAADTSLQQGGAMTENPLAGGMPSLTEGASRKDLPEAMRTKMENAFGADFSNLNIIESEKVAEGGARAVTQGNTIAFAPGEFNVYSPSSEALLGHELSHVVSQARGESRGNGLLTDSYLEAKADREGVMAAAGQQVYSGPITPLSSSSPMSVAGPMQCKKNQSKLPISERSYSYQKGEAKKFLKGTDFSFHKQERENDRNIFKRDRAEYRERMKNNPLVSHAPSSLGSREEQMQRASDEMMDMQNALASFRLEDW